jgi:hypothetical protein
MAATAIRTFLSSKIVQHLPLHKLAFTPPLSQLHHVHLPPMIDLRTHKNMPPVYDQGQLSSCTANALVASFQYEDPAFFGSRLFLYYNERLIEHDTTTKNTSAAHQLHDGIRALRYYGVCAETDWPYDISKFDDKPPPACYHEAVAHKATQVTNIRQDVNSMKNCLYAGLPFVVGIQVFEEFESQAIAQSGIVPMPTPTSQCIGGHSVLVVGYDDANQQWIVRNSWGADWGDHGYFYLPYLYLLDGSLSSDLWKVNRLSHPTASPINNNVKFSDTIAGVLGDTLTGALSGAVTGVMSNTEQDPIHAALSGAILGATGGGITGAITGAITRNNNQNNQKQSQCVEDENRKLKQSAPL